jgi:hypothetical protein
VAICLSTWGGGGAQKTGRATIAPIAAHAHTINTALMYISLQLRD